ncbi:hypothetical protein [Planctomycetes bacterium TBK1r]|uniref:DoxX n=1 Tax=Stieleria magnilauensis TaxID=2527963 RepID=A0ABX5XKR2_9BACT|nr:hypothetical protein TBK1r_01410 [Planctomycetes bacterium TBK1r]
MSRNSANRSPFATTFEQHVFRIGKAALFAAASGYASRQAREGAFGEQGVWIAPLAVVLSLLMSACVLILLAAWAAEQLRNPKIAAAAAVATVLLYCQRPNPAYWITLGHESVTVLWRVMLWIAR